MQTYTAPTDNDGTVTKFAWPGGYRVWYVTHDGAGLCAECVETEKDQTLDPTNDTGWRVVGHYHEGESDEAGPCDHCERTADTDEAGAVRLDSLAFLAAAGLATVPVGLLVVFLARLAGAVAGVQ